MKVSYVSTMPKLASKLAARVRRTEDKIVSQGKELHRILSGGEKMKIDIFLLLLS